MHIDFEQWRVSRHSPFTEGRQVKLLVETAPPQGSDGVSEVCEDASLFRLLRLSHLVPSTAVGTI